MHDNSAFGRALNPTELKHSRYLGALTAFRPTTCLTMTQGTGEGGDGQGGSGGQQGAGGQSGQQGGQGGTGSGQQQSGQQQQSGGQQSGQQTGQQGSDKGFPENTPVAEMTAAQQAAYYKDKAQKHEDRNKALLQITGGKHGDDLKAVLDEYGQLKSASQTDAEKAVEDAKKQTRAEVALDSVRAAFDLLLPDDMSAEQKEEKLGVLNLAAFLTSDGKVDTAKVKTHVATLAPAKDQGQQQHQQRQWGQGGRDSGGSPLGSAGAAEAERRFGKKSESTS